MLIQKLIRIQGQPHDQSQRVSNTKAIPMPELTPKELLAIAGAGAKRMWGDMF